MKLVVSKIKPDRNEMFFWVDSKLLEDKSVHFYIACNKWEQLDIELDESMPIGVLDKMVTKCEKVYVTNAPIKLTEKTATLLGELYPEKTGKILKDYLYGKDWDCE